MEKSQLRHRRNQISPDSLYLIVSRYKSDITFLIITAACAAVLGFPSRSAFAVQANEVERKELERQLVELESQIEAHESTVQNLSTQGKTLKAEIGRLDAKIGKLNLQIEATKRRIRNLDFEIGDKEGQIKETVAKIDFNKDALTDALRRVYESSRESLVEVLLKRPKLSDFFGDVSELIDVQDGLTLTIDRITDLKQDLEETRDILALKRDDARTLKISQDTQRTDLNGTKKEKGSLLTVTKGEESRYQKLLVQTKKSAAQIRSKIFQLLGGGELTFEDAYKFAKLAEGATGVRAALIMAVLDRESALGRNVGRCNYKTAMHPKRDVPIFLALTAEIGLNPDTMPVSCANSDGAYGGAMGPAQFIPSTWDLYKEKIVAISGHNPPSPWNNSDAFIATALYLQDAGAANATLSQERIAAAKYYAGSRWRYHLWGYGDRVVTAAQRIQADINILNS